MEQLFPPCRSPGHGNPHQHHHRRESVRLKNKIPTPNSTLVPAPQYSPPVEKQTFAQTPAPPHTQNGDTRMDFTLSQSQTSKWEAFFFNCAHLHTVIHQHLHFPGNDSTSTTANCGDCTEPSLCAGRPCKAHYIIVPFHYDPGYGQWHEAKMYEKCAQQHNIGGSLVEFCDRSYVNYGNISSRSIPNSIAASGKKCERMSRMYALPLQI